MDTEARLGKSIGVNPKGVYPPNRDSKKRVSGDAAFKGGPPTPFPIDPDTGEYIDREGNA